MSKKNIDSIVLAVCTCLRPKMLLHCLNSIAELKIPQNKKVELLIIDNDINKSAFGVVNDFQNNNAIKCHYFTEERRGLAFARNKLLDEAIKLGAEYIFMFDDDEILTPDALIEHIKLSESYEEAIISSGVVFYKFQENTPNYIKKNVCFKQKTSKKTGEIKTYCASGNVFFPTELVKEKDFRFSEEFIFMGGEDGDFFSKASKKGYKIIQNSEAVLYEVITYEKPSIKDLLNRRHTNTGRASLKYIFGKSYYNGFSGSFSKFRKNKKKLGKVLYIFRQILTFTFDLLIAFPALIFGITGFVNCISMSLRAAGKIMGSISTKPLEFYKTIYGE